MAKYTAIGGQALIEGILMRSPEKTALAVRKPDKEIDITYLNSKSLRDKYKILRIPVIRGMIAFVESLVQGYKAMMMSAEKSGFADIEEEEKKDKNAEEETGTEVKAEAEETAENDNAEETAQQTEKTEEGEKEEKKPNALLNVAMIIGSVLGVVLAVFLFLWIPNKIVIGTEWLFNGGDRFPNVVRAVIEKSINLIVLVTYMWSVSLMPDIRRVFMYHGAEHKTIFCYEKGLELSVENVRKQKRFHPRCGTSFLVLMIFVSIIISTLAQMIFPGAFSVGWLWVIVKIALVPVICGIGFEILRFCGKYDNILTKILSAPGLWMQRITTKEPEDEMIEIAIAALRAAEPEKPDVDRSIDERAEKGAE